MCLCCVRVFISSEVICIKKYYVKIYDIKIILIKRKNFLKRRSNRKYKYIF